MADVNKFISVEEKERIEKEVHNIVFTYFLIHFREGKKCREKKRKD